MGVLAKPIPFGDYFLLEKVNTGGMAEVYKAKTFGAEGFERIVAVKKILPSIAEDKEFITMFINEAKLAVQLTHANICQIHDLGCINGDYYIAMEYVPGHDLRVIFDRCVRTNTRLDIGCVCYIISKICEGLDYAHNKKNANGEPMNIIHRDISPQNILISYDGECKLIDFGIAKASTSSNATQVGILKGKFSYMSPEQVSGKQSIDRRSDIFALGIVLFEMLTLKRLFLGDSDFATLEKIRKVEVSPPTLYNSAIPEELEDIVLKALEKDVSQRYQTAQELQEALQRFMFRQNLYYTAKDLSEFCHKMFAQEIALEQKKMEFYKELTRDVLMQSRQVETDDETSFYEKQHMPKMSGVQFDGVAVNAAASPAPAAPKQAIYAELDDFQPPAGDGIVYSSKNAPHPPDDVNALIAAPLVASDHPAPVPRKSMASSDAVIVNKGRETVLTVPVVAKNSSRRVFAYIVGILVLTIIGLLFVGLMMRPKDSHNGMAQFVVVPADVPVRLEIDNEPARDELLSPIKVDKLSTAHETHYRFTAEGYQAVEGDFKATSELQNLQIELKPLYTSLLTIFVDQELAEVTVDGRRIDGNRHFEVRNLAPGQHVVRVSKEGYRSDERRIDLEAGGTLNLTPELRPLFATLVLKTEPYAADYVVRNRRTGETYKGQTNSTGVTIPNLPADDEYNITIINAGESMQAVWQPNIRTANQVEVRTFPATKDPEAKVVVVEEPKNVAAPAAAVAPSAPKPAAPKPRKENKDTDDSAKVAAKTPEAPAAAKPAPAAEPAPAPAPKPAADVPGILQIASKPPANIFINGKDYGTTPKKIELPAGSYTIRFVNKDAGIDTEQSVTLDGGEVKKVLRK